MFNTPSQKHRRQPVWNKLVAIVALVGALGFLFAHAEPAHAGGTQPPAFPSVDQIQGSAAAYHPTPVQRAYAADKGRLSQEYVQRVLTGQETLADFETHYRAFMVNWHLGDVAGLHTALTRGTARLQSATGRLVAPQCPSVADGPQPLCPAGAAQFPEELGNWCGPATLSTTLVEDSWFHSGTNQYGGHTLTYNANVVTQWGPTSGTPAYDDEYWLATHGVISGDITHNGTSVNQMTTVVDQYVNGKGGWYAQEWLSGSLSDQIADYQPKVSIDIGTGWDVPDGIDILAGNFYSMPGYPYNHAAISHWVPVTWISSDGNTVYYSDPVYASPAYNWPIPAPYEATDIGTIVLYTTVILW
jgi:hypothetical protein